MRRPHLFSLILIAALCSCEQPKNKESLVTIIDPRIETSGDIIEYLEAATLTGATKVSINGHSWSFNTPFHSNLSVDLESLPAEKLYITDQTTEKQIKEWLEMNRHKWITYTPTAHSNHQIFWTVIDTMESLDTYYSTSYPEAGSINLGLLEAIEPTTKTEPTSRAEQ